LVNLKCRLSRPGTEFSVFEPTPEHPTIKLSEGGES
jgi:hypothetical protein